MRNLYWACVDEDGTKTLFEDKGNIPERGGGGFIDEYNMWCCSVPAKAGNEFKNFPPMTWADEPIKVRLVVEVVPNEYKKFDWPGEVVDND